MEDIDSLDAYTNDSAESMTDNASSDTTSDTTSDATSGATSGDTSDDTSDTTSDATSGATSGASSGVTKSKEELREELYRTFTIDRTEKQTGLYKGILKKVKAVKPVSWLIDKIFENKTETYTDNIETEHRTIVNNIKKKIENGYSREEAVSVTRNEFVYGENDEAIFRQQEEASKNPGFLNWNLFKFRAGGSNKTKVITGTKKEYQDDKKRFERHLEIAYDSNELKKEAGDRQ